MLPDSFYINNHMTAPLESFLKKRCKTYEDFESPVLGRIPEVRTCRIGQYLDQLLYQHDEEGFPSYPFDAHLSPSYVGNIINFKKNNPSLEMP